MVDNGEDDVRAIVNPKRSEAADELADHVDVDADVIEPPTPDEISEAAEGAVADGADAVAAIGGDGTQRTVAEAVAGTDADLAVVPGGTVNLLARVLGVETIADAAEAIDEGSVRRLDLGRCGDQTFILNSTSGYDAAVIEATDDRVKRFGRLGYALVGVVKLVVSRPRPCTVTVDGQTVHEGDAITVLVLNVGERGSASFKIAPDAEPDDGVLDVVVIKGGRRSYVRTMWARVRGRLPASGDAVFTQGTDVAIAWSEPVPVQCDGDAIAAAAEIDCTIDPSAVRVRTLEP